MKKRDYGDFVQDIPDPINDIGSFIEGMDLNNILEQLKEVVAL